MRILGRLCLFLLFSSCAHVAELENESNQIDEWFTWSEPNSYLTPSKGKVISPFGPRKGRFHYGVDIKAKLGDPILAVKKGEILYSGWMRGYGKVIKIKHKSHISLYAHCSKIYVRKGQWVRGGQKIAEIGKTGNATGYHLHFELQNLKGKAFNPTPFIYPKNIVKVD